MIWHQLRVMGKLKRGIEEWMDEKRERLAFVSGSSGTEQYRLVSSMAASHVLFPEIIPSHMTASCVQTERQIKESGHETQ